MVATIAHTSISATTLTSTECMATSRTESASEDVTRTGYSHCEDRGLGLIITAYKYDESEEEIIYREAELEQMKEGWYNPRTFKLRSRHKDKIIRRQIRNNTQKRF